MAQPLNACQGRNPKTGLGLGSMQDLSHQSRISGLKTKKAETGLANYLANCCEHCESKTLSEKKPYRDVSCLNKLLCHITLLHYISDLRNQPRYQQRLMPGSYCSLLLNKDWWLYSLCLMNNPLPFSSLFIFNTASCFQSTVERKQSVKGRHVGNQCQVWHAL